MNERQEKTYNQLLKLSYWMDIFFSDLHFLTI